MVDVDGLVEGIDRLGHLTLVVEHDQFDLASVLLVGLLDGEFEAVEALLTVTRGWPRQRQHHTDRDLVRALLVPRAAGQAKQAGEGDNKTTPQCVSHGNPSFRSRS